MQLELELSRVNTNIKLTNKFYIIDSDESDSKITSIPKSPEVIARLDELFEGGTSASAIKTFMNCQLDFYYKYVLKFGEEKKVEEEVESNTFGTFIHEVLEDLYEPFSRRDENGELKTQQPPSLQPEDIDKMLKGYELLLRQKFSAHFNNDPKSFETGKNFLSFQMAKELLERFLKFEKKQLLSLNNRPFFIEALEQQFIHVMELEIAGKMRKIKLKGFADRIDSCDGQIRIVDYKTGKVDTKDVGAKLKAENQEEQILVVFDTCIKSKHFFQLLVYNYLYFQKYQIVPANCSIISFVKLEDSPFDINLGELNMQTAVEVFPEVLRLILEDIYNEEMPFEHTTDYYNYCEYCV
jgi:RecB family exonuclease